jgi:hypothetical protein
MIKPHATVKAKRDPEATVWDYAALESLDEFKELANEANVVIALDTNSEDLNVAYGTETLRAIQHEVIPPQKCAVLYVAVDYKTKYVEHLCAALKVTKGFHEWNGGGKE